MVSPDAQVDVDDVVVSDGEAAKAVRDREGPPLVARAVVPDDPKGILNASDAEAVREPEAAELRVGTRPIASGSLADGDLVDRLATSQRDVAIGAAERAGEVERDPLTNEERPVWLNPSGDVRGRQRIRLRRGRRRQKERAGKEREERGAEPAQVENCTDGASRAAPSVSK